MRTPLLSRNLLITARNVSKIRFPQFYSTKSEQASRTDRPLRLAVIGAGPAGFYTAYRVLSKLTNARVDMYESSPVPYGLVRFGVAPDHPEVKKCQDKFAEVACSSRFTYIGNVPIGISPASVPLSTITTHYDALLLSYGASKDRTLSIPGETSLAGVLSARAFVGWYNGLPEYATLSEKLALHDNAEAVIIGQGNVALDVARILLTPIELLRKTDMAQHAIDALSRSKVRTVRIMGRRGPLQTAFTAKELRELLSISSVDFRPVDESLLPPDVSKLPRQQKRIMQLLMRGSATSLPPSEKSWELRFLRTPTAFLPSGTDNKKLGAVRFEKTRLEEPAFSSDARAVPTGEFEDIPAEIAFRSIGYLSEPLAGFTEAGIPFNGTRGLVPNEDGRVVKPAGDPNALGTPISGVYTSGWVKRGPTGVISNTMYDAFETADAIVNDWVSGNRPFMNQEGGVKWGWEAVEPEVKARGGRPVSWDEWIKIDEAEKERGRKTGKEREKFVNNEEMLAVLE